MMGSAAETVGLEKIKEVVGRRNRRLIVEGREFHLLSIKIGFRYQFFRKLGFQV